MRMNAIAMVGGALLVWSASAQAQALAPVEPAPTLPAPPARPPHANTAMMGAGIGATVLGIVMVPVGLGLWFGTPNPPCSGFFCIAFSDTQIAGMTMLTLGYSVLPAIGIPLWVNGAKPATLTSASRASPVSWSFAPFVPPPPRPASERTAVTPAGLAVVGSF